MSMEDLLGALVKTTVQAAESSQGQQALTQVVGGLLGGNQQGTHQDQVSNLLGSLEQVIGGAPGSGNFSQSGGMNLGANDPIMLMLQPVVNQLATKAKIEPQIAMVVVSLVVHYLLSSHPQSGKGGGALNLTSLFGELASGGVNKNTLHSSGMVDDVVNATGLPKEDAVKALDSTFNILSGHVQSAARGG